MSKRRHLVSDAAWGAFMAGRDFAARDQLMSAARELREHGVSPGPVSTLVRAARGRHHDYLAWLREALAGQS